MSAWGRKRQAVIIGYILLLALIVALFFYFFVLYNPPSCFDGKQNGLEEGVDCGGACALVCPFAATSPNILWARSFEVGPGVYNMVASVENPNFDLAATVDYVIRGYNEANVMVAEIINSVVLSPQEQRIIFHQGVETKNSTIARTFISLDENYQWYKQEAEANPVQMISYRFDRLESAPLLEVVLGNTSVFPVENLEVVAVLFNQDGNVEHSSRTLLDEIAADGESTVFFSWREPFDNYITRVETYTRVRE